jgi:hypothetical protein
VVREGKINFFAPAVICFNIATNLRGASKMNHNHQTIFFACFIALAFKLSEQKIQF